MIRKRRKGQSLVEMAVIFPFFLLVVVGGIIDFGFTFFNFLTLQQIANDTARYAAEGNGVSGITDQGAIQTYANSKRPTWWTGQFTVHPREILTLTEAGAAQAVKVILSYESPTYTPFYQTMLGAISGTRSIRLAVIASYQIPQYVATR